jgi:hypothetical protein
VLLHLVPCHIGNLLPPQLLLCYHNEARDRETYMSVRRGMQCILTPPCTCLHTYNLKSNGLCIIVILIQPHGRALTWSGSSTRAARSTSSPPSAPG